jgi:predicted nuclease of predicted toxin-antitoxin system
LNFGRRGILIGQNLHVDVVGWLSERYAVTTARDAGLATTTDLALMRYAEQRQLVVVTHDTDLGELALASASGVSGVVLLRPAHRGAEFSIAQLEVLLEADLPDDHPFLVVLNRSGDSLSLRFRRLS